MKFSRERANAEARRQVPHARSPVRARIDALERAVVGATRPALTLIFDLDPNIGLARAKARGDVKAEDRYERKGVDFHHKLRDGFLDILRKDPKRSRIIDASLSIDDVADSVWDIVNPVL